MGKLTTDRQVKTAGPGMHGVSGPKGLHINVQSSGASRSWILRVQRNSKRYDLGLGPFPEVTLVEAREKAMARRREILAGVPALAHRQAPRGMTFREAAEACLAVKAPDWKNAKHRQQWANTLAEYVLPLIGDRDVKSIETADVLAVLRPIWTTKHETARRLRQRIEIVLGHATAAGARSGLNPARWDDNLAALLPRMAKARRVKHHAALPWADAAEFMAELQKQEGSAARALRFVILTACRSGEARLATWGEVDLRSAMWVIPPERMKAHKEHRVPLTPAALAVLGPRGDAGDLLFPAQRDRHKPLTDTALGKLLKRISRGDLTVHGFRSTFRDWAGEATAHPREVAEHALAHGLSDATEAAYQRGDLLQKRRVLMNDWGAFLNRPAGDVVALPTVEREAVA